MVEDYLTRAIQSSIMTIQKYDRKDVKSKLKKVAEVEKYCSNEMATKSFTLLACVLLVLVLFETKSDAIGTGPTRSCPNGSWCYNKKIRMVRLIILLTNQ